MLRQKRRLIVGALIVLFWLGMMSLLVYREVLRPYWSPQYRARPVLEPKEYWYGVFSGDQRVGFVNARVAPKMKDDRRGVALRLMLRVDLPLFGKLADLSIHGEGFRQQVSSRTEFDFSLSSAGQDFRAEGILADGELDARLHTGDTITPLKYTIPDDSMLTGGMSGFDLPPLRPGEEIYVDAFNPMSMAPEKARVVCTGQETLVLDGESILTHVLETHIGSITTRAWVDEDQDVVRVVTPFGFTLQRIDPRSAYEPAEPDEQADMIRNLAVRVKGVIPTGDFVALRIRFGGVDPSVLPPGDLWQTRVGNTDEYTILQAQYPPPTETKLPNDERVAALASDALVNAAHERIVQQSAEIVGNASTDWDKVQRLYTWVFENIEKTSVLSVPTALEVLRTRQGDCNEHTVLFTALARAAGIPTRIAIGLVYSDSVDGFGYHAWPEVFVGNWIPIDPTLGQPLADATHLKLLNGGIDQWPRLVAYIGQAEIEILGTNEETP